MRAETELKVEAVRKAVKAGTEELTEIKAILANNTDEYINGLVRQASFWLDDVETYFLAMLKEDSMPPRTALQESRIVDWATMPLNNAMAIIKNLNDLVKRYGPTVVSVG